VGKVIKPHGLQGLLRIWSYAQSEKSFLQAGSVFLKSRDGEIHEYTVLSVQSHKNIFLMKLKELCSLEQAEYHRGAEIYIKKDNLIEKDEDEYFWYELLALGVYLENGEYLGSIQQIIPTGGNDIYVVKKGENEILIPAIYDVIKEIDIENGKMVISAIEGLIDLNEI
jgi:16S rRNA processing protein RimM